MNQKLYLSILAAAVLCAIPSCTEKAEDYVPADSETGNAFYFATDTTYSAVLSVVLSEESGTFEIPVYRMNSADAATANLTVTLDDAAAEVLTVPSSVSFDAGANASMLQVAYANAVSGQSYSFSVDIVGDTSEYGVSSLSVSAQLPSEWSYFLDPTQKDPTPAKVTFTQSWWGEVHTGYIRYIVQADSTYYCETCDEEGDISGAADPGPGFWGTGEDMHLVFTWNPKTNYIDIPVQSVYYSSNYSAWVNLYDMFAYYNVLSDYAGKWDSADIFYSENNTMLPYRSYYDGNGGFYFYVQYYYMPGIGGWGQGVFDIVGIADGFERTTDYNTLSYTEKWSADVESEFFGDEWSGQKVSICDDDSTIVYLPQYFTETTGLAFCLRTDETGGLTTETAIEDVANEQYTGVDTYGDRIYVKVKKGEVLEISEEGYPVFSVTLSLYSKRYSEEDSTWTKQTDYPSVTETITVTGGAWYSADNLSGLKKASYTSYKWLMEATDLFEGERDYISYVYFEDAGTDSNGYEWLTMTGLSGWGETYWADGDGVDVMWYGGYLYLQPQSLEDAFAYGGSIYSVDVYLLNSTEGSVASDGYLFGGYSSDDGLVAFTNYPYNDDAVDGVYWYANGLGGLSAWYKIALYRVEAISSSSASIDIAPLGGTSPSGRRSIGKSLAKSSVKANAAKKEFTLSPLEKTAGRDMPIEKVKNKALR